MADNAACCACLHPSYDPIHTKDGFTRERWACKSCGTEFVKRFWFDKAEKEREAEVARLTKERDEAKQSALSSSEERREYRKAAQERDAAVASEKRLRVNLRMMNKAHAILLGQLEGWKDQPNEQGLIESEPEAPPQDQPKPKCPECQGTGVRCWPTEVCECVLSRYRKAAERPR